MRTTGRLRFGVRAVLRLGALLALLAWPAATRAQGFDAPPPALFGNAAASVLAEPGEGIDCACDKTGNYKTGRGTDVEAPSLRRTVRPKVVLTSPTEGRSPDGKYQLSVIGNATSGYQMSVREDGSSTALLSEDFLGETHWGFSPADDQFAYWYLSTGNLLTVKLYDLKARPVRHSTYSVNVANVPGVPGDTLGNSYIGFSPSGEHLLVAAKTDQFNTTVTLLTPNEGNVLSKTGAGPGWGFSPGENRFVYWTVANNLMTLDLYDLDVRPVRKVKTQSVTVYTDAAGGSAHIGFSPEGGYLLISSRSSQTMTRMMVLNTTTGTIAVSQDHGGSAAWGFSPNDHGFAMWTVSGSTESLRLYDLRKPSPYVGGETASIRGGASRVGFSPNGEYLMHAVLTETSEMYFSIFDMTGMKRYHTTVTFYQAPGNTGDKLGRVNWSFSPDARNRSFTIGWADAPLSLHWMLINLEAKKAVYSRGINAVASFWTFSPCGDVVALAEQGATTTQVSLMRTAYREPLATQAYGNNNVYVRATGTSHEAVVNGQTNELFENTAGQSCAPPGPPELVRLVVTPGEVDGGETAEAIVVLNKPAPTGGVEIALSSNKEAVVVPSDVTIPAGEATASFEIATTPVLQQEQAILSALYDGVTKRDTLIVKAIALTDFEVRADTVVGGNDVGGFVFISGPAPEGGVPVQLQSSHPAVLALPAEVVVPEGEDVERVNATTAGVAENTLVILQASRGSVVRKDTVLMIPADLVELRLDLAVCGVGSNQAIGGRPISLELTLNGLPPADGATVALASSAGAASPPATVTFGPQDRALTFEVQTQRVTSPTPVVISATYRGRTETYAFTLIPPPYEYNVVDLGAPFEGASTSGIALNNQGTVIVRVPGAGPNDGSYVWQNGVVTHLPTQPGFVSDARDINDAGQIVGRLSFGPQSRPALWQGDSLVVLGTPGNRWGGANAINDLGQIVGFADDESGKDRPALWEDSTFSLVPAPGILMYGYASDINNLGMVIANVVPAPPPTGWTIYHTFMYDPATGDITRLNAYNLPGFAYAINDAAEIAGYYSGGIVWQNGTTKRFGVGDPEAINEAGMVVGSTCIDCETRGISFATLADTEHTYNLNCLIPEDSGWHLQQGSDINDQNQIVGYGFVNGARTSRAFLLTTGEVSASADLAVQLTGARHNVVTEEVVTFALEVENNGQATAAAAEVSSRFEGPLVPQDATSNRGTCAITDRVVRCDMGDVSPGATASITITATADTTGRFHANVLARSNTPDANGSDNVARVTATVHPAPVAETEAEVPTGHTGAVDLGQTGLQLYFTDGSETNGALVARQYDTAAPNNDSLFALTVQAPSGEITPTVVSGARYWTVEASGLTAFTYTICLDVTGLPGVVDPQQLVIVKREDSEEAWTPLNTTLEQADAKTYLCTSGLNSFSQFGVASNSASNPLPVELTTFEAVTDGSDAVLRWTTASETNNAGFEVQVLTTDAASQQREGDVQWQVLGFVEGRGTTEKAQRYEHRVMNLAPGRHTFRLKQVDYDGALAYSPEVELSVELPGRYDLGAPYPNPFNPETQFTLTLAREEQVTLAAYDLLGRRVALLHDGRLTGGTAHRFRFEASTLPSGIYFIRAVGESFQANRRVTLVK